MAKTSTVAKEKRKVAMTKRHRGKRAALKAKIIDPALSEEEKRDAMFALTKMPRNGAAVRVRRRCQATGAARGNYRKFGLNRRTFRKMALAGLLPGVTKASW
jgi:small subunit ribosomal protein S14